jgi:chromosome segregation ATPase
MDNNQFYIALGGIIFSILSGVATGGYALYRQLKTDQKQQISDSNEYRLNVEAATWQRANDIMCDLTNQLVDMRERVQALESALAHERKQRQKAEDRIEHLEAENVALREALANGGF